MARRRLREGWASERVVKCAHCGQTFSAEDLPYGCEAASLPEDLAQRFLKLHRDSATDDFLESCLSTRCCCSVFKDCMAAFFQRRVSLTDANALLGRGQMFVLSTGHAETLLGRPGGVLVDLGAGDGAVTEQLRPLFDTVVAVEVSAPMVRRLQRRGFVAFQGEALDGLDAAAQGAGLALGPGGTVDCVALLNVLDRCDAPTSLLRQLRARLAPSGRLLLAVVLPFRPFVERGPRRTRPREQLPMDPDASWEASVAQLWSRVLQPLGFELEAVARLPYLSAGDSAYAIYALDDAVFVLRRRAEP